MHQDEDTPTSHLYPPLYLQPRHKPRMPRDGDTRLFPYRSLSHAATIQQRTPHTRTTTHLGSRVYLYTHVSAFRLARYCRTDPTTEGRWYGLIVLSHKKTEQHLGAKPTRMKKYTQRWQGGAKTPIHLAPSQDSLPLSYTY